MMTTQRDPSQGPGNEPLLHIGSTCTICHTVDFLPTLCPSCNEVYCTQHIKSHQPCNDIGPGFKESNAIAGPSSFIARGICEFGGCGKMSIEGISGLGSPGEDLQPAQKRGGGDEGEDVAMRIRCEGCGKAFCVTHRAQTSHNCKAPLLHNVRHDAFVTRKTQAQAVLAKTFPQQARRVIPKPPPPKSVPNKIVKPKSTKPAEPTLVPVEPIPEVKKPKTKEEKLWDIHVRKVKSLATLFKGISSSGKGDQARRYFEWSSGEFAAIEAWEGNGKWSGKLERSWVFEVMPLGRLLDLMMGATNTPIPKDLSDPSQTYKLLMLDSSPDAPIPRRAVPLKTDLTVGEQVGDGISIILCKGWTRQDQP